MINFQNINYLKDGTERQKAAYLTLKKHDILEKTADFNPILTGTIPIAIDIPQSDLDIICYWKNKIDFINRIKKLFSKEQDFNLRTANINGQETVIANFRIDNFEIEFFGQHMPTASQNAFKHMLIAHQILQEKGEVLGNKLLN